MLAWLDGLGSQVLVGSQVLPMLYPRARRAEYPSHSLLSSLE
jgi:hypothetical protein